MKTQTMTSDLLLFRLHQQASMAAVKRSQLHLCHGYAGCFLYGLIALALIIFAVLYTIHN